MIEVKSGDIVTLMLLTMQQIVCRVVEVTETHYLVEYPFSPVPMRTQDGVGLGAQPIDMFEEQDEISIDRAAIISVWIAGRRAREAFSGFEMKLRTAKSGIILGV